MASLTIKHWGKPLCQAAGTSSKGCKQSDITFLGNRANGQGERLKGELTFIITIGSILLWGQISQRYLTMSTLQSQLDLVFNI